MAATFQIKGAFELRSRGMLMVVGEILDGVVGVGDWVSGLGREVSISGVEMLTRSGRPCDVALGLRYSDEGDLSRLRQHAVNGDILDITSSKSK